MFLGFSNLTKQPPNFPQPKQGDFNIHISIQTCSTFSYMLKRNKLFVLIFIKPDISWFNTCDLFFVSDQENQMKRSSKSAAGSRRKAGSLRSKGAVETTRRESLSAAKTSGYVKTQSAEEDTTLRVLQLGSVTRWLNSSFSFSTLFCLKSEGFLHSSPYSSLELADTCCETTSINIFVYVCHRLLWKNVTRKGRGAGRQSRLWGQ